MFVKVTQEHINKGLKRDIRCCPIALALNEILAPAYIASVCGQYFLIKKLVEDPDEEQIQERVQEIINFNFSDFTSRFDDGLRVEPIIFDAPIPNKYLKV